MDDINPAYKEAVEAAAKKGWHVFPCHSPDWAADGERAFCSCGKDDCKQIGKHPRTPNGVKDATTDLAKLAAWNDRWPDANWAVATGPDSGIWVIDWDGAEGADNKRALIRDVGPLGETRQVRSGGDGVHDYYPWPKNGTVIRNSTKKLASATDVRGDGGYVLLPGSLHKSGNRYEVAQDVEPQEAPEYLITRITKAGLTVVPTKDDANGTIPEGARNDALISRGGYLRRGGFGFAGIYAALLDFNRENCDPPLPEDEVKKIAQSAMRWEPKIRGFPHTDLGNAERLITLHGNDLRYCHDWGTWLIWDGARWVEDRTSEITRRAKATVRAMYGEAEHIADGDERKALIKWGIRSEANNRIRAMIDLAQSDPRVSVSMDELDADPWLLNVQNGTIDLRTGTLQPHDRDDLITKLAPVDHDPTATASTFETFLARILPGGALRGFVRRTIGYMLTGDVREQKLFFAHGMGANGKTTLINLILDLLGDYGQQAASDLLIAKRRDRGSATPELVDIFGARFVACVEVEDGAQLAESLVKQITGRDRIWARQVFKPGFEFDPTHTILLAANHKPKVRGTDHAIWRRIMLIPFDVTIPESQQDKELPDKLRAELPGVLAWAVRGCLEWQRVGLNPPAEVLDATEEYRRENDPLSDFFEDCCTFDTPDAFTPSSDLLEAYGNWTFRNKRDPVERGRIFDRLRAEGCTDTRKGKARTRGWSGIGLLPQDDYDLSENGSGEPSRVPVGRY